MKKFSVIVPVYNRPGEVKELMESLAKQTSKNFDLIIVEDGSTIPCKEIADEFKDKLDIVYYFKENTGPGDSRNFGMSKAQGEYLVFFDSDCLIPEHYFETVEKFVNENQLDCYGGPDAAHESFTLIQKSINYAMTSIFTTGGVRGKENKLDNYQPRSFNMGFKRSIYEQLGGFSDIHPGEDPDLSYRIMDAGYKIKLIPEAYVYHKRRIDFKKFAEQVYKFGVVRTILMKWHPERSKIVYWFPSLFLLGSTFLIAMAMILDQPLVQFPFAIFVWLIFFHALFTEKNLAIAFLAVPASLLQLYCYGAGFIISYFKVHILKQPERAAFPDFFFKK